MALQHATSRLTVQEQACLRLVARRLSSREIAEHLGIAKTSVDTYCNRARRKLGVADRYAAARLLTAQECPDDHAGPTPTPADRSARVRLTLVAMITVATLIGLGSLLAGMTALDALQPPGWAERVAAERLQSDGRGE